MPRYLLRLSASADTWEGMIKNPSNRLEANRSVVESMGGKLEGYYLVVGENESALRPCAPSRCMYSLSRHPGKGDPD